MKRGLMSAMAVSMLCITLAWAKPKEQTFAGTQQQVFEAAQNAARENYIITYADERPSLTGGASAYCRAQR